MKYMFLLYDDENAWDAMSEAEQGEVFAAHGAYMEALRKVGGYVSGAPLPHSREAKRIRGERVEDGPFADGREELGGFYMVDLPDLDAALEWAARCPAASTGHVEVRPVWTPGA